MIKLAMPVFDKAHILVTDLKLKKEFNPQILTILGLGDVTINRTYKGKEPILSLLHTQSWENCDVADTYLIDYMRELAKTRKFQYVTILNTKILYDDNVFVTFRFAGKILDITYALYIDVEFSMPSSPLYKVIEQYIYIMKNGVKKYKESNKAIVDATGNIFIPAIVSMITLYAQSIN